MRRALLVALLLCGAVRADDYKVYCQPAPDKVTVVAGDVEVHGHLGDGAVKLDLASLTGNVTVKLERYGFRGANLTVPVADLQAAHRIPPAQYQIVELEPKMLQVVFDTIPQGASIDVKAGDGGWKPQAARSGEVLTMPESWLGGGCMVRFRRPLYCEFPPINLLASDIPANEAGPTHLGPFVLTPSIPVLVPLAEQHPYAFGLLGAVLFGALPLALHRRRQRRR